MNSGPEGNNLISRSHPPVPWANFQFGFTIALEPPERREPSQWQLRRADASGSRGDDISGASPLCTAAARGTGATDARPKITRNEPAIELCYALSSRAEPAAAAAADDDDSRSAGRLGEDGQEGEAAQSRPLVAAARPLLSAAPAALSLSISMAGSSAMARADLAGQLKREKLANSGRTVVGGRRSELCIQFAVRCSCEPGCRRDAVVVFCPSRPRRMSSGPAEFKRADRERPLVA